MLMIETKSWNMLMIETKFEYCLEFVMKYVNDKAYLCANTDP